MRHDENLKKSARLPQIPYIQRTYEISIWIFVLGCAHANCSSGSMLYSHLTSVQVLN